MYVDVALPLGAPVPYTYLVPPELAGRVDVGQRVLVPLRGREVVGVIVERDTPAPAQHARTVLALCDRTPALTVNLLRLARWISGYYGAPLGLAIRCMLPGALWGASGVRVTRGDEGGVERAGKKGREIIDQLERRGPISTVGLRRALGRVPYALLRRLEADGFVRLEVVPPKTGSLVRTERVVQVAGEPLTLTERASLFGRAPRQRAAYEALEARGGTATARHLKTHEGVTDAALRALAEKRLITLARAPVQVDPFAFVAPTDPPSNATEEQGRALRVINDEPAHRPVLLHGVTGSGKTFVYLETIRRAVAAGQGAILLIPEIALTPQTVARVRGVFGDRVAVLHSALSDAERAEAWWGLRTGRFQVAVGARSAVFAPLPTLGVVVIDEEHEAAYKQTDAPRYHARTVAAVRARYEGARLVLGSATPSLETWSAAEDGAARRATLGTRIASRPLPPVEIVDLRAAPSTGSGPVPWSIRLDEAIGAALRKREQVMLLLNRRGFASFLLCPGCGVVCECPQCSISLTVHTAPRGLRCHYCGHTEPLVEGCAACGKSVLHLRGVGTQQVERLLVERFPTARVARMDVDTTGSKWAHHHILGRVERHEVDILVGTQMIAKGLDFPNITLVGVVDADTGLHLPDFRAAERTFDLIAQVAGRAGRGAKGGRVIVQTRAPDHYALAHAATHDVAGFLARERMERATPPYPPHVSLLRIVLQGEVAEHVAERAHQVRGWLETPSLPEGLVVLGPAPAPIERIRGRWRWHLIVKSKARRALGQLVRRWVADSSRELIRSRSVQVSLDRDPTSLL